MEGSQYKLLVENLRIDGVLTSAPLVRNNGEVLSGNHRVEAALEAGIEEADVIEIVDDIDDNRALALQLSHNAIAGSDDPGRLANLYSSLDLTWKRFSGLTDDVLNAAKELDITALAIGAPQYQELMFLFLPEQADIFLKVLGKVEKLVAKSGFTIAGHYEDFGRVFDAVVAAKRVRGIHNSAVALRTIAEIALRALEGEEAAKAALDEAKKAGAPKEDAAAQ